MTAPDLTHAMFHESTIRSLNQDGSKITIELDDVSLDGRITDGNRASVLVAIGGVETVFRNSVYVDSIKIESSDGELLALDGEKDRVVLVIQWCYYKPSRIDVVVYDIIGGAMSFELI